MENSNCYNLIGQKASLSFQAKTTGNAIRKIRAAVLAWTGTTDSVTRDVVTTWNGAGTDPAWVANWEQQNTPSDLELTSDFQTFTIEDIPINNKANNVAVFIWVDDTDAAVGDELLIGQVQLEKGAVATDFEHRSIGEELALCKRYFMRYSSNNSYYFVGWAAAADGTTAEVVLFFPVEMRAQPSLTKSADTALNVIHQESILKESTGIEFRLSNPKTAALTVTVASGLTQGEGLACRINGNETVDFSAEF